MTAREIAAHLDSPLRDGQGTLWANAVDADRYRLMECVDVEPQGTGDGDNMCR